MWVSNICLAIRGSAFRRMACTIQRPHGNRSWVEDISAYSVMSHRKHPGQSSIVKKCLGEQVSPLNLQIGEMQDLTLKT